MVQLSIALLLAVVAQSGSPGMQQRLASEDPAALARAARTEGDPARGAIVFHLPQLLCAKCHANGEKESVLGPDLSRVGKDATDAYLVESILAPSKIIKKGYETVTVATKAGKIVSGLLVADRPDEVVVRASLLDEALTTIPNVEIDERKAGGPSLMPAGLADGLSSRQQFLDLVSYLREIADKGPARALELRPAPSLLAIPLPEYEKNIDHASLISTLGEANLRKGEAIFSRVCANCHGRGDQPGSMPTSTRFASGTLKNGSDPLSLYRTLTHGFNQMPPQTWMVPQQKYDVIHYLREAILKPSNPSQYAAVDRDYLARLPKGTDRGPEPSNIEPWLTMDYGPSLMATVEAGTNGRNIAYKGISVRVDAGLGGVSRGRDWVLYDHDTMRVAAAWSGAGFIDWQGINFDGRHGIHPRLVGEAAFSNSSGPGWAEPVHGSFDDPRPLDRDGRPYGPMPKSWMKYQGFYRHGDRTILAYRVGDCDVLEMPGMEIDPAHDRAPIFTRTLEIGRSTHDLTMKVADNPVTTAVVGDARVTLAREPAATFLRISASSTPTTIKVLMARGNVDPLTAYAKASPPPASLRPFTRGGPGRWPEVLKTQAVKGTGDGPFQVDVLTHPASNPWSSRMRLSGFDFFADGRRAAVCDWDGDVWLVGGLDDPSGTLTWRRIGSGLFQPLGLKIVDEQIYVGCRDQIVILRDLNGDGETDYYECFNDDHQVTEHFHEFAMGLQTDAQGDFYYAKAARHGKTALVPQHGTLLRVSKDGSRTEIIATGFRAPNGVCVNGDGTFYVTDQEGFWNPKNRINLVKPGRFYGNMWGYHNVTDESDSAMEPPVAWITNAMDRSPAEMLRVPPGAWGPLSGSLLSLSYGYGKVFIVPNEDIGGTVQGGVSPLPIPQLPTGIMRGRFHPGDKQLYACGLFGWAGNQEQPGGFYRIRSTGKPVYVPIGLEARKDELAIQFSGAIDPKSLADLANISVKTWSLKRSQRYGSDHHDEAPATIRGAKLSDDNRTLLLDMPGLKPTWCMEVRYNLRGATGEPVDGVIHNTIHRVRDH